MKINSFQIQYCLVVKILISKCENNKDSNYHSCVTNLMVWSNLSFLVITWELDNIKVGSRLFTKANIVDKHPILSPFPVYLIKQFFHITYSCSRCISIKTLSNIHSQKRCLNSITYVKCIDKMLQMYSWLATSGCFYLILNKFLISVVVTVNNSNFKFLLSL